MNASTGVGKTTVSFSDDFIQSIHSLRDPLRYEGHTMAKKRKSKLKVQVSSTDVDAQFKSKSRGVFSSLAHLDVPIVSAPLASQDKIDSPPSPKECVLKLLGPQKKLKLTLSKKGRGGKVVTLLQTLEMGDDSSRKRMAKQLGKALGCRVWIEEKKLCLQGDQRDRVRQWVDDQV